MPRQEQFIKLAKAAAHGDRTAFDAEMSRVADEAESKGQHVFARRLAQIAQTAPPKTAMMPLKIDHVHIVAPLKRLDQLRLAAPTRGALTDLAREHRRAADLEKAGLEPRHKVLLTGPPGNGKTATAHALANLVGLPLMTVRYESVVDSYLGVTTKRLAEVFQSAARRPSVLFFDEFDMVGKERGNGDDVGEMRRVVGALLMQMDAVPARTIIVAATNHPAMLDYAAWRRFDVRLSLPAPTRSELRCFVAEMLRKAGRDGWGLLKADALDTIAAALDPTSYAEAEEFCLGVRRRLALDDVDDDVLLRGGLSAWRERKRCLQSLKAGMWKGA